MNEPTLKHHIVEGANIVAVDRNGNAIPNRCVLCGEPASYGKNGVWSCSEHWQMRVENYES